MTTTESLLPLNIHASAIASAIDVEACHDGKEWLDISTSFSVGLALSIRFLATVVIVAVAAIDTSRESDAILSLRTKSMIDRATVNEKSAGGLFKCVNGMTMALMVCCCICFIYDETYLSKGMIAPFR